MVMEPHYNLQDLQTQLREIEARTRLIVNLTAIGEDSGHEVTEVTQNRRKRAKSTLVLALSTDTPPVDTTLDFAGTAYLENSKTAVVAYREKTPQSIDPGDGDSGGQASPDDALADTGDG